MYVVTKQDWISYEILYLKKQKPNLSHEIALPKKQNKTGFLMYSVIVFITTKQDNMSQNIALIKTKQEQIFIS